MSDPTERADILARRPRASPITISGELLLRLNRMLQALQGFDLSQLQSLLSAGLQLDPRVTGMVTLANIDAAPFRTNGQNFTAQISVAAGGAGNFSLAYLRNLPTSLSSPPHLIVAVLDEIAVGGGASQFTWGFTIAATSGPNAFVVQSIPFSTERQQTVVTAGATNRTAGTPNVISNFQTGQPSAYFTTLVGVLGVDGDPVGIDAYSGAGAFTRIPLGQTVLFPGVSLFVQSQTVNVALAVRFSARLFDLGVLGQGY